MTQENHPVLHVTMGDITGNQTFNLETEITIGREASANRVVIPNLNVSRKHARVYQDEGKYILEDLGSHNGTLLNGRLARKEVLQEGDVINIADVELRFQFQAEKADSPDVQLSNTDMGQLAEDSTSFIDLSELNPEAMEKLRGEKEENERLWEEDGNSP